ncbi:DUF3102 domain-containing protein [Burkholderia aenigmatica]|uniref:DUF3102 domain-containing protein n=1 Tax=Burkholderia aenigmatica TaxID=2015348 RepID=UPI001F170804|nr:DUF3102 domain-containing protein [Burkholderia aenigmatica]UKD14902.1 DUF3102 domain-containing protein [Burkholderia aenigmatica]
MGRNKRETTVVPADNTLEVLPALTEAANTLAARSSEIAKQFGDGLPYERSRIVNEARFYMAQSAEAMLEAGKRLILLKENEPHGEFTEIVEDQLGLNERTARRMMAASVKFMSPALESKRTALSVLGKTKLFELVAEDDEDLAALADGGTVAGMTLDDIDRMTSRELRAALREAHANATAQSRLLSDKNAKIDELATKKTRVKRVTADQEGAEIRKETSAIAFEAESVIRGNLRSAFETLTQHAETHGAPHDDFMAGVLGQIQLSLNQLRSEFGVKAAADGDDVPQWLRDTAAGAAADDHSRAAN